jgi:predicted RNase H-like HicB family nuclease
MNEVLKYLIVIEKSSSGFSAYSPDVYGCITTGESLEETLANMESALEFHLEGLLEDGDPIPQARGIDAYLDALRESEGEAYFMTHLAVASVLPTAMNPLGSRKLLQGRQ